MPWVIAFLSGAALMAFEILSAQLIAPFYGQSLAVWSCVIGVTLAGLSIGYLIGGRVADRWPTHTPLVLALALAAILIGLAPTMAGPVMSTCYTVGLRTGALLSAAALLLPPLAALGMVSPTLLRLSLKEFERVGRGAGALSAVSTAGGIVATLAWSWWLIPEFGARMSCTVAASALWITVGAALFHAGKWHLTALPAAAVMLLYFAALPGAPAPGVVYRADGLHGQTIVVDRDDVRTLLVDGVAQTSVYRPNGVSPFRYIHALAYQCAELPPGSRALLLGLGGGTLANELARNGFEVVGVEIDPRLERVAREYFSLDPRCRVAIDDARRYINASRETFDAVVIDCFAGEREPAHLLTLEAFRKIRSMLSARGMLLINYIGFSSGPRGAATRSVFRTLVEAGFQVYAHGTDSNEEARNIVIAARLAPTELPRSTRALACCDWVFDTLSQNRLDLQSEPSWVMTDDRSALDALNVAYHEQLRTYARRAFGDVIE